MFDQRGFWPHQRFTKALMVALVRLMNAKARLRAWYFSIGKLFFAPVRLTGSVTIPALSSSCQFARPPPVEARNGF